MARTTITSDTPGTTNPGEGIHTLSIFVNNKAGVLMRICQVFARRGYNIESLVVSQGRDPHFSRTTIGLKGAPEGLEQIIKQVNKLIDVIHCCEHTSADAVVREMLLIKFLVEDGQQRTDALQIIEHFNGKTVDLTPSSMVAMITGDSPKVDAAVGMLSQFDIIETVRTGKVVMARGEQPT
ncbi:MAG: acetolactate synthase small subunit [Verrucomicrobiota bacterium]|jgi:acetolactate synthase-1/3 small subunit|nr:acetolactate synthase small subunit [Verrucomicrobiota bacterium]|tara:strand:- start:14 stop:556 length:543 start_codon:yes stop_codon:yes gene_type:complete